MPPRRISSTKTLFDDVFSSIPANVFIDFGPTCVMEEVALEETASEDIAHRLTRAATAVSMYTALEEEEEDTTKRLGSSTAAVPTSSRSAVWQPLKLSRAVGEGGSRAKGSGTTTSMSSSRGAPQMTFELDLDETDEAVQEATKYASYVKEAQAREAKMAEERLTQRRRLLEQTLYTGGVEDMHERGASSYGRGGARRGAANESGQLGNNHDAHTHQYNNNNSYSTTGSRAYGGASSSSGPSTHSAHAEGGRDEVTSAGSPPHGAGLQSDAPAFSSAVLASETIAEAATGVYADVAASDSVANDPDHAHAHAAEGTEDGMDLALGGGGGGARPNLSPEEQVARMPPGKRTLYTGRCAMFRHGKDFGFLAPDAGGPDVYFTRESVFYTFTRLALRRFYEVNGVAVPRSVSVPLGMMEAAAKEIAAGHATPTAEVTGGNDDDTTITTTTANAEGEAAETEKKPDQEGDAKLATSSAAAPDNHEDHTESLAAEARNTEAETRSVPNPEDGDDAEHTVAEVPSPEVDTIIASTGGGILPTPSVRVQQPTVSEAELAAASQAAALAAAAAAAVAGVRPDERELLPPPPLTKSEVEQAEAAAALLTSRTAQLLQWQIDLGAGAVAVNERVTFTSHWNKAAVHGKASRLLRGEHVRGVPSNFFALQVEQAWFMPLFPDAVGRKRDGERPVAAAATEAIASTPADPTTASPGTTDGDAMLERYYGTVRGFVAEDQRGYLRPDEPNTHDVVFNTDAVLWDARCPPASRVIVDRMRVCYSVCGRERQRYTATLITAIDGTPLSPTNVVMADDGNRRGGRRGGGGDDGSGGGGNANNKRDRGGDGDGGGGGGAREGGGGGGREGRRKRTREDDEEALLLFDESDYASMI